MIEGNLCLYINEDGEGRGMDASIKGKDGVHKNEITKSGRFYRMNPGEGESYPW